MKTINIGRAVLLTAIAAGGMMAPAPAMAQYEELRQCFRGCHQAYVVETNQPGFYQMCIKRCNDMYGTTASAVTPQQPVVRRYS